MSASKKKQLLYRTHVTNLLGEWLERSNDYEQLTFPGMEPAPDSFRYRAVLGLMLLDAWGDGTLLFSQRHAWNKWRISEITHKRVTVYWRRKGVLTTIRKSAPGREAMYQLTVPDWLKVLLEAPETQGLTGPPSEQTRDHGDPVNNEHRINTVETQGPIDPPPCDSDVPGQRASAGADPERGGPADDAAARDAAPPAVYDDHTLIQAGDCEHGAPLVMPCLECRKEREAASA